MNAYQNYWWGYLHSNNTIQVQRWFGDHKDYTEDCDGNEFVLKVVKPFIASSRAEAVILIIKNLNEQLGPGPTDKTIPDNIHKPGQTLR